MFTTYQWVKMTLLRKATTDDATLELGEATLEPDKATWVRLSNFGAQRGKFHY